MQHFTFYLGLSCSFSYLRKRIPLVFMIVFSAIHQALLALHLLERLWFPPPEGIKRVSMTYYG